MNILTTNSQSAIFIESYDVARGWAFGKEHMYLVFSNSNNQEFVIRGGPANNNFFNFGNIVTESGIAIEQSKDNRKGETPEARNQNEVNLNGRNATNVWHIMKQQSNNIANANINYNAFINAQNSNSTIASVLHSVGIYINNNLPKGKESNEFPGIHNLLEFNRILSGTELGDIIWGYTGNDSLYGGSGNDTLKGWGGNDDLRGEGDNDELLGGTGVDTLYGGDGDDALYGGNGDDQLHGEDNNDLLVGEAGNDFIDGGNDNDTASYRRDPNGVVVNLGISQATDGWGGIDTLYNIENIIGSDNGNDNLSGNNSANIITGGYGNDIINGAGGNDGLYGEFGNDIIIGGSGQDSLYGNQGQDTIWGDLEGNPNLGDNDYIRGGDGDDEIHAGGGDDLVNGGLGKDQLWGGGGGDTFVLAVGEGFDSIFDFTLNQDFLGLAGGLTFEQLSITQGSGSHADNALIAIQDSGEILASLTGIQADMLNQSHFTILS